MTKAMVAQKETRLW